jgi:hypothetical protein
MVYTLRLDAHQSDTIYEIRDMRCTIIIVYYNFYIFIN